MAVGVSDFQGTLCWAVKLNPVLIPCRQNEGSENNFSPPKKQQGNAPFFDQHPYNESVPGRFILVSTTGPLLFTFFFDVLHVEWWNSRLD